MYFVSRLFSLGLPPRARVCSSIHQPFLNESIRHAATPILFTFNVKFHFLMAVPMLPIIWVSNTLSAPANSCKWVICSEADVFGKAMNNVRQDGMENRHISWTRLLKCWATIPLILESENSHWSFSFNISLWSGRLMQIGVFHATWKIRRT